MGGIGHYMVLTCWACMPCYLDIVLDCPAARGLLLKPMLILRLVLYYVSFPFFFMFG